MTELRQVTGAKPMDDTKVFVTFDNGVSGVFDCAPYMKESYWSCLKSPTYFRQVKAECGTLCWPNDIDIDPEEVWEEISHTLLAPHSKEPPKEYKDCISPAM